MKLTMHAISVPYFAAMLTNLSHVLSKAETWAIERKIDPQVLLLDRLAPDMLPFSRQVMIATDHAKGGCARLANVDVPSSPDTEMTIADLQSRIAKVRDFIVALPVDAFMGAEDRMVKLRVGPREMEFEGLTYLQGFAMPNFLFHVTTAYAILRHNGVPLGKGDFFGRG